jgi:cobalamin synthase
MSIMDIKGWWDSLPYQTKGALVRAVRAGVSVTVAILLTALTAGVLLPASWSPIIVIAITAVLQAVDKYLRESGSADTPPTP